MACLRARALSGRRQVAVVTGEAGIGKTWFCERVTADAERDGFDVVRGRCWPHAGAPALWPWPAVLAMATGPVVPACSPRTATLGSASRPNASPGLPPLRIGSNMRVRARQRWWCSTT
ncbi:MAG: ATP-binding protein [Actinomycetota bacterium]|nr:ATP-binding protein [Actinomycetota bacterium]